MILNQEDALVLIIDAQEKFTEKATLVSDVLNNIQNIYANSERIAMQEAQQQILEMVRNNQVEKIREFGSEIDAVAQHHRLQTLAEPG